MSYHIILDDQPQKFGQQFVLEVHPNHFISLNPSQIECQILKKCKQNGDEDWSLFFFKFTSNLYIPFSRMVMFGSSVFNIIHYYSFYTI